MIDIKFIREQPDQVKQVVVNKKSDPAKVDEALDLDIKRREFIQNIESLKEERNYLTNDGTDLTRAKGKEIKDKLKLLEPQLKEVEAKLDLVMRQIPNLTLPDVPTGRDESENVVIRKWGTPRQFDFPALDHLQIGEKLGVIDMETAGRVSGPQVGLLDGGFGFAANSPGPSRHVKA